MQIFNYDLKTDDLTHRYSDVCRSGTSSYIRSLPSHENCGNLTVKRRIEKILDMARVLNS